MSQLEAAIVVLVSTFQQYAASQGKKDTLTNAEAKTLLEKELPCLLKAAKNPEEVDKVLKSMDLDGDNEIDFSEFMILVASLTCACHDLFTKA
ncbi:hypothetical protein GBF38_005547 [Nibea albiflora]|uniref:Uncharacterized protein n=1 Tax=Nibea albiflora TaxID=240163 RepID=A0ACB7EWZ6_NIBAL|nr:hypothetical protein GBF38_005547 [Nibea albiflora]